MHQILLCEMGQQWRMSCKLNRQVLEAERLSNAVTDPASRSCLALPILRCPGMHQPDLGTHTPDAHRSQGNLAASAQIAHACTNQPAWSAVCTPHKRAPEQEPPPRYGCYENKTTKRHHTTHICRRDCSDAHNAGITLREESKQSLGCPQRRTGYKKQHRPHRTAEEARGHAAG